MYQTVVEADPKAKPLVSAHLVEALIAASKKWTVTDVREIIDALGMKSYFVTHSGVRLGIREVLDKYTDSSTATYILVAWNSGPRGRHNVQSNLAHWLLDNLMWEVRLKCDQDVWVQEKLSELRRIAGFR